MSRAARFDMDQNGNILLIRLRSIGDILFTGPAIHLMREAFPDAKITFLVSKEHAPLLAGFRDVNEVMPLDRALYRRGNPKSIVMETLSLLRRLRRGKFALAVDFQGYGETALLTWWTRAPERWGAVYQAARGWAYTRGVKRNDLIHPAEWNLSLLYQCGLRPGKVVNEFTLPASALQEAHQFFAAHQLSFGYPVLFIQPFTSTPKKNWPLENFLALAAHWRSRGVQVVFGGGPADHVTLEPVRQLGFVTSTGVPLLTSAGIAHLSTVVVGGVTGLLHLAVAMQKRVIMLVGYPAQEPGFPYQHRDWVVVPPTGGNVSEIQTDAVIEACAEAFTELGVPGTPLEPRSS